MSKHTPAPWRRSKSGTAVDLPNGSQVRIVRLAEGQSDIADAKHIVKCVNMHDEYVAEAQEAIGWLTSLLETNARSADEVYEILIVMRDRFVKLNAKAESE